MNNDHQVVASFFRALVTCDRLLCEDLAGRDVAEELAAADAHLIALTHNARLALGDRVDALIAEARRLADAVL